MARKPAVIAYDVVCNRRRRRLRRCLQAWQLDAQHSVFECDLSRQEAEELFLQLAHLIEDGEDRLLLAWLDNRRQPIAVTKAASIGFNRPAAYLG